MTSHLTHIAFLRGINVGGHNKIPMQALRDLCESIGFTSVKTLLQTGNIHFSSNKPVERIEADLEAAIEARFGFSVPVTIRKQQDFESILDRSPFATEVSTDPSRLVLYMCKKAIREDAQAELQDLAQAEEQVYAFSDALWIYFPNGIGRSKLTPTTIDKAVGSPATGRNWKTLTKIRNL